MAVQQFSVIVEWDAEDDVWVTHVSTLGHLSTYGELGKLPWTTLEKPSWVTWRPRAKRIFQSLGLADPSRALSS